MSIFRREKTDFFGKAKKTKTLAEPHQKNKWITTELFFRVEMSPVKNYEFTMIAIQGKVRCLVSIVRLTHHRRAALWAKHNRPPDY